MSIFFAVVPDTGSIVFVLNERTFSAVPPFVDNNIVEPPPHSRPPNFVLP